MSAQWEYKVQTYARKTYGFNYDRIERDLNDLGREGWEVVGTLADAYISDGPDEIAVLLKRPGA
ncbi:DUF4177 domain-containing protein [Nocardiopsis sediminis]|uniref:DUF4177 domain-containing protein n=1 Tax=Nocardiopsis sediminis TaxID=1778267 RepID=A0ABV8FIH0_9ACTN